MQFKPHCATWKLFHLKQKYKHHGEIQTGLGLKEQKQGPDNIYIAASLC